MVLHRDTGKIEHRNCSRTFIEYFSEGDALVLNDTKVFPARLYGNKEKTGAKIEVFLLRELNKEIHLWDVLVDPARKIRVGNKLYFGESDMVAEVIDNTTSRGRTIKFLFDGSDEEFYKALHDLGETPDAEARPSPGRPSPPTRSVTRLSTPSTPAPWPPPRPACTSPAR